MHLGNPGWVVVLNGAPRSGKSSIVEVIQEMFPVAPWMNLGVDVVVRQVTPERYRRGIGLRPGGERPDLEPLLPAMYRALYATFAAHSRLGLNVVAGVGHHEGHSRPLGILPACAGELTGLPTLFVGVRCSLGEIMRRRKAGQPGREGVYVQARAGEPVPEPVRRWQEAVHQPGIYDLEVDTTDASPAECASVILRRIEKGTPGAAFAQLARLAGGPGAGLR